MTRLPVLVFSSFKQRLIPFEALTKLMVLALFFFFFFFFFWGLWWPCQQYVEPPNHTEREKERERERDETVGLREKRTFSIKSISLWWRVCFRFMSSLLCYCCFVFLQCKLWAVLTLKAPSKICSRRHLFLFLFLIFQRKRLDISCESSAVCQADDSHEISRLVSFENIKTDISKCRLLQLLLALLWFCDCCSSLTVFSLLFTDIII